MYDTNIEWLTLPCTAFDHFEIVASGELGFVVEMVKQHLDNKQETSILIFDDQTSQVIDVDFRGTAAEVVERVARRGNQGAATTQLLSSLRARGAMPGRPKLGVVAREVTLLPRHWEWLSRQPGGASVALRKLVEEARKSSGPQDAIRQAQESTYRFMTAIAGDLPGFEEALRALFASNSEGFKRCVEPWPAGVGGHALKLAGPAFTHYAAAATAEATLTMD